jgi:hypothetical protein
MLGPSPMVGNIAYWLALGAAGACTTADKHTIDCGVVSRSWFTL